MGIFVDRVSPDGSKRGLVCKGRIPGDATNAEAIEGIIVFIALMLIVWGLG